MITCSSIQSPSSRITSRGDIMRAAVRVRISRVSLRNDPDPNDHRLSFTCKKTVFVIDGIHVTLLQLSQRMLRPPIR